MISVIIHVANEDPILGEIDALPSSMDTNIIVKNPRRRDGKDLHYIEMNVTTVLWPLHRVNFIEVVPGEEDEQIITHYRE